jgi:hypothetical protein
MCHKRRTGYFVESVDAHAMTKVTKSLLYAEKGCDSSHPLFILFGFESGVLSGPY